MALLFLRPAGSAKGPGASSPPSSTGTKSRMPGNRAPVAWVPDTCACMCCQFKCVPLAGHFSAGKVRIKLGSRWDKGTESGCAHPCRVRSRGASTGPLKFPAGNVARATAPDAMAATPFSRGHTLQGSRTGSEKGAAVGRPKSLKWRSRLIRLDVNRFCGDLDPAVLGSPFSGFVVGDGVAGTHARHADDAGLVDAMGR